MEEMGVSKLTKVWNAHSEKLWPCCLWSWSEQTCVGWKSQYVSLSTPSQYLLTNIYMKFKTQLSASNRWAPNTWCHLGPVHMYSSPNRDATNLSPYRITIHSLEFCDWIYLQVSMVSNRIQPFHPILLCLLGSSHVCKIRNMVSNPSCD